MYIAVGELDTDGLSVGTSVGIVDEMSDGGDVGLDDGIGFATHSPQVKGQFKVASGMLHPFCFFRPIHTQVYSFPVKNPDSTRNFLSSTHSLLDGC